MNAWIALPAAVLLLLALYPGELSWLSTRGTRWLYNRAASNYADKFARNDYGACDRFIAEAALGCAETHAPLRVLDLGCGTGHASLAAAAALKERAASYTAVDFSPAMLQVFRHRDDARRLADDGRLELCEAEISPWLQQQRRESSLRFDLVLLMEVGEFLPQFPRVLRDVAQLCTNGATLVMTRPAGAWAWCFPRRAQRSDSLRTALAQAGFEVLRRQPWRGRYELLCCQFRS